ncbi:MAG: transporter permease [Nitrospirae bacterium]|nr:transporter permease [Nitrospirota bacterium]
MRHLKILEYALSSILRRKYRNISLITVYALTISILASVLFLTHSLKLEAAHILIDAPDLVVQKLSAGRHDLIPSEYAKTIREIPGVGAAEPRYWGYYYDALSHSNYTLIGIDRNLPRLSLLEGRMPSGKGECAIGEGVAIARIVAVGDMMPLISSRDEVVLYKVTGTFRSESNILTNDLIVMGRKDLLQFFNLSADRATDITVTVHNPNEVTTIADKIKKTYPASRPITKNEIIRTYDAVFNWRSGMMLTIFASALIAFCILAWDKATGIGAEEKHEIGILKAIGWDTADILELKFWEGIVISLTSFLIGLIVAFVHVFFLNASILSPVIKGWSVLFPAFRLTPYIDIYQIFVLAFLTVTPYVASTIIPSWKTAITDPENVMRS